METQFDKFFYEYQLAAQHEINAASNKEDLAIIAALNLKPFTDGSKFCFLWGENIQDGVAGFGDTVHQAVKDFNVNFFSQKLPR